MRNSNLNLVFRVEEQKAGRVFRVTNTDDDTVYAVVTSEGYNSVVNCTTHEVITKEENPELFAQLMESVTPEMVALSKKVFK